jgi:hypothetical protein
VLRDPEADLVTHVAVLQTLGAAPRARRLSRSRARPAPSDPEPATVTVARATMIEVRRPLGGAQDGGIWLRDAGEGELAEGLRALHRVLDAFRVVAADPHQAPIARDGLLAARLGWGSGEQVADGRYSEARELPPPPVARGRRRTLAPQARLAAILGGREAVLACEELVLRARADLDAGRTREAALQALIALDAGLAELAAELAKGPRAPALAERLDELRGQREPTGAAAQAALTGVPDAAALRDVELTVNRLEAALRARSASWG